MGSAATPIFGSRFSTFVPDTDSDLISCLVSIFLKPAQSLHECLCECARSERLERAAQVCGGSPARSVRPLPFASGWSVLSRIYIIVRLGFVLADVTWFRSPSPSTFSESRTVMLSTQILVHFTSTRVLKYFDSMVIRKSHIVCPAYFNT